MIKSFTFSLSAEGALGLLFGILAWVAEINWVGRAFLVLISFGLVSHIAWRLHEKRTIRAFIVLSGIITVSVLTWRPIYDGALSWTLSPPSRVVLSAATADDQQKLLSTAGSTYLRCHYPKRENAMPFAQARDHFRVYGNTIGISSDLSEIPGGLKFTFTPTPKSILHFGVARSLSIAMRRNGEDVLVDIESKFPGALAILGLIPEDVKKPDPWENAIETLLRANHGSCRVL
ncbi:hypothetical protein [Beijerinckia sp. L45]|uniref:hypothetical protein n=1 Tax=Beijerinckia sp. L45 TaxID=1641855 RepID=UPI00131DF099|nr:hypothetical protein [Beijerinckia sp. L45]